MTLTSCWSISATSASSTATAAFLAPCTRRAGCWSSGSIPRRRIIARCSRRARSSSSSERAEDALRWQRRPCSRWDWSQSRIWAVASMRGKPLAARSSRARNPDRSETEAAQARMIQRTRTQRPSKLPFRLRDRQIIDGGVAAHHQPVVIEFPVFIAVGTKPVSRIVAPFVGEAHRDAIFAESPQFLDKPVLQFACPLAAQKRDDRFGAHDELRAIAPAAVGAVGARDPLGFPRIPRVLGSANLLHRSLEAERR